jgi:hypothetical protein
MYKGSNVKKENVIYLADYKSSVTVEGIDFPQVYRLEGYGWKEEDGAIVPSTDPADRHPPMYTLNTEHANGLCNATWTPIMHLDPEIDRGRVIVRHHVDESSLSGYCDAMIDIQTDEEINMNSGMVAHETNQGLFSIIHLENDKDFPKRELIYIVTLIAQEGVIAGLPVYHSRIVKPDGTVTISPPPRP